MAATARSKSRIDLHLHTTCSDGTLTPAECVARARARGLTIIAITDHDTIDGIASAQEAAAGTELWVLPGIEFNTDYHEKEVHVLGYGFDPQAPALQGALVDMKEGRRQRNYAILDRLAELGLPLEAKRVEEFARGEIVARPHLARAMVQAGYVGSVQEAFDIYLKKDGSAFVERESLTPQQACRAIRESGGLPVLAHPAKLEYQQLIAELLPCGLRGLEAYHPEQSPPQRRALRNTAARLGLLVTGGSDSHGPASGRSVELGSVELPARLLEELIAALAETVMGRATRPAGAAR